MSGTLTVNRRNTVPHMNGVVERFTTGTGYCPASSSDGVPPTLPDLEGETVRLGVHVTWQELPCGICGVYDWPRYRIVLHDGLTPVQARGTLCHELEHVRMVTGRAAAKARPGRAGAPHCGWSVQSTMRPLNRSTTGAPGGSPASLVSPCRSSTTTGERCMTVV